MSLDVVQEALTAVSLGGAGLEAQHRPRHATMTDGETALRELLVKGADASVLRGMIGFAATCRGRISVAGPRP